MDLEKAAHEQAERVIEGAISPLSNSPLNGSNSPSEFLKKHLSVEDAGAEEEEVYAEPTPEPYSRAIRYLEQHSVVQLFQRLTTSVLINKPDEPLDYMLEEVDVIRKLRNAELRQKQN